MKTFLFLTIIFLSIASICSGFTFQAFEEMGLMLLGKLLDNWVQVNPVNKDIFPWHKSKS